MFLSWFMSHQWVHDPTLLWYTHPHGWWRPESRRSDVLKSHLEYSPVPHFWIQRSYNNDSEAVKSITRYSNHEKAFLLTLFWKIYEPIFPRNCISSLLHSTHNAHRREVMNRTQVTSLLLLIFPPESNAVKQKYDTIRLSTILLILKG